MQTVVNLWPLIGVLVIVVGFAIAAFYFIKRMREASQ